MANVSRSGERRADGAGATDLSAPINTAERVEAAARLLADGHPGEAETMLRAILERDAGNPDALNTFASLALARNDAARAFEILGPACTAYPVHPRLLSNLGLAHFLLGRPGDAVLCLERAVAVAADDVELRLALGQYRAAAGEGERALAEIEEALRMVPDHAGALAQLGALALAAGDRSRGEAALRRAAAADPANGDVLGNLSVLCGMTGRHAEALVLAERAHLRAPLDQNRQAHLAACRAMVGDFEGAVDLCKRVLVAAPDHLAANQLYARLAIARGAVESGISTLSKLVRKQSRNPDAILALAGALRFAGRMTQALAFVDQALAVAPDHVRAQAVRTELLLTLGRFADVWPSRAEEAEAAPEPRTLIAPRGTTLIEAVLFGRFACRFGGDGLALRSDADPAVTDLLRHGAGIVSDRAPDPGDAAILLQGLPVRWPGPDQSGDRWLTPDPVLLRRWQEAFRPLARPLIGIAWDEFPPGFPLRELAPIVAAAGTPISFATGPERHQLRDWPQVIDAGVHVERAADLVAAVSCLDGFVGTDGVPLHLAGALVRPGIAVAAAGYPWALAPHGDRLAWHPSLRRVAQTVPGRWDDVLASLPGALRDIMGAGREDRS